MNAPESTRGVGVAPAPGGQFVRIDAAAREWLLREFAIPVYYLEHEGVAAIAAADFYTDEFARSRGVVDVILALVDDLAGTGDDDTWGLRVTDGLLAALRDRRRQVRQDLLATARTLRSMWTGEYFDDELAHPDDVTTTMADANRGLDNMVQADAILALVAGEVAR
jgi:hypothetical protein